MCEPETNKLIALNLFHVAQCSGMSYIDVNLEPELDFILPPWWYLNPEYTKQSKWFRTLFTRKLFKYLFLSCSYSATHNSTPYSHSHMSLSLIKSSLVWYLISPRPVSLCSTDRNDIKYGPAASGLASLSCYSLTSDRFRDDMTRYDGTRGCRKYGPNIKHS